MKYVVLIGRILFSSLFILSAPGLFAKSTMDFAASQGLPLATVLIPLFGLFALVGGVSVLLGYKAKMGAWLLVIFTVCITFSMHKFWGNVDPMTAGLQQVMFIKNLSLLGAALLITHFGSGPMSMDKKKK